MKLKFIGTGAADFRLDNRVEGGFFRRWSSLLINDDLLIDPGPHVADYLEKNECPTLLDNVKYVLITHSHGDHLNIDTVKMLLSKNPDIEFWGNKQSMAGVSAVTEKTTVVEFNQPVTFGKYTATPFHANHSPMLAGEQSFLYGISDGEKEMFYGTDTSWLPTETWYAMRNHKYDCMVMEVTLCDVIGDPRIFEHNNIRMVEIMMETFRKFGTVKPDAKVIATHMAKGTHGKQEQTVNRLACFGMVPAYDGYTVEI